jgi:hypothetical protein
MLMRGVIGNGTVCGCPAPKNHMKLASPLVPVLILYVARDCLRGPLLDLSRESETGQPARVIHCRSPSPGCRSRFTRRMRLHLAFAYVCPRSVVHTCPRYSNAAAPCASTRLATAPVARHSTWVANLVLERGALQRSPPPSPCSATGSRCFYSSQGRSSLFQLALLLR